MQISRGLPLAKHEPFRVTKRAPEFQNATSYPSSPAVTSGQDDPARMEKFDGYVREGRLAEVEPLLRSYIQNHNKSSHAYYLLGRIYYRQKRIEDSIRVLSKSIELDDQRAEAHILLGRALTMTDRCDQAERELELAVRLDPNSPEAHYGLGRVHAAREEFGSAREQFEQAIKLNPNYAEAHNALGFALDALDDDAGALASYHKAIEISGARKMPFEAPYVNLSGYYNRRRDAAQGIEFARKALAINPQSDLAYFNLGRGLRILEKWPEAAEALEHAIALKPSAAQYHYVLSSVYKKLGKSAESQASIEKFRELETASAARQAQKRSMRGRPMGSQRDEAAYE